MKSPKERAHEPNLLSILHSADYIPRLLAYTEGILQYGSETLPYSTLPTMSDSTHSSADPRYRSGRYQNQLAGYRAFLPAPLPPNPPVRLEGEIQSLLSLARCR